MYYKIAAVLLILALATCGVVADISSSYSADTWTYTFTTSAPLSYVRIWLDPNILESELSSITAGYSFGSATEPHTGLTLKYLHWGAVESGIYNYSFSDNPDDNIDLTDHSGPLLWNPADHANAYAGEILDSGWGSLEHATGWDGMHSPITPEPGTLVLLGLGLGGLATRLRRRRK